MIDLHTHILPNIDDGARNLDEALKMTESLQKQNITKVACTPHFDPTQTSLLDFYNKRNTAMQLMCDSKITLIPGSETLIHDYLFHYSKLDELCIGDTKYLLIELPHGIKWDMKAYDGLEKLISYYGVIPIIAHIERYQSFQKNEKGIERLIDMGCVIQLNTSSIIDKKKRHRAFHYMKHGYIDVLGSDCHNMKKRPPNMKNALDIIIQNLGPKYCNDLMYNAECILNGKEIRDNKVYIIK